MERFRFYVQCENLIGQTDKTIFDAYVIVLAETVDQTGRRILAEVNSGSALDAVNNGLRRFFSGVSDFVGNGNNLFLAQRNKFRFS